jgi:copper(I)-binding protein
MRYFHVIGLAMMLSSMTTMAIADDTKAGDTKAGDLIIHQPWSRAASLSIGTGVVYLEIDNTGQSPDRLIAVSSPIAAMAHLHTTEMQGDMASMKAVDGVEIPAGGKVVLKPQTDHVMLMGLTQALAQGSSFPLDLQFEKAGKVHITVPVGPAGALGPTGN